MKNLQLLTFIALSLLLIPSCVKESFKKGTVQKACYGSFIKVGDNRYQVCNFESLDNFDAGQEVRVTFKHIHECTGPVKNGGVCQPTYHFDGWIHVVKISDI